MKSSKMFTTLCGISLPVNKPNVRWYPDKEFVDCIVCLRKLKICAEEVIS